MHKLFEKRKRNKKRKNSWTENGVIPVYNYHPPQLLIDVRIAGLSTEPAFMDEV